MKSVAEMKAHLVEKAAEDDGFRTELVADPRSVVEREFNIAVPEGVRLEVLEDSADAVHLVLPPAPSKLGMEELRQAAGGAGESY